MSWDEIKKAREIWPPNIDKILDHFEKAEKLDPNYYQVYKDRARLFYVLKRYGKSNEDYERWRSLDEKWDEDIKNDLLFHKQSGHKGIYPWEDLQKYFDSGGKHKPKEKKRIKNVDQELNKNIVEEEDESSNDNLDYMYYDKLYFDLIGDDIKNGNNPTLESIKTKYHSFITYFKYLNEIDENGNWNITKLYEFCKIKLENKILDESTFENVINKIDTKFKDFFISNKKYLEKWNNSFCQSFMIFYQHLHHMPINVNISQNFEKIIEPSESNADKLKNSEFHIPNEYNKEFFEGIKNKKPEEYDIENECIILIREYKKRVSISEHNIGLMEDMIEVYAQIGSLRKLCQETELDISIVRNGFRNLSRVPTELRELVIDDKLIADPILATEIAVYATDYFEWDQEEDNTNEVIKFAKNIAQKFKDTLELRSEFFATKDDYCKPISATTKKNNELNAILEDWPVKESEYEFNKFTDRSGKQYKFIVFYSKNPDAARFLRRWEYEKGRRISKKWASEIIDQIKNQGNIKEFLKDHSNEFND